MNFIETIKEKARNNIKKIILPETMDKRVLKAASICHEEKIAEIVLIGKEEEVLTLAKEENINLEGITIINPFTDSKTEQWFKLHVLENRGVPMNLRTARLESFLFDLMKFLFSISL